MDNEGYIHYSHTAKVFSTDPMVEVAPNAVEIMGSYGYAEVYGMEKIIQISIGANELIRSHAWHRSDLLRWRSRWIRISEIEW